MSGTAGDDPEPVGDDAPYHDSLPDSQAEARARNTESSPEFKQQGIEGSQPIETIGTPALDSALSGRPIDPWAHRRGEPRVFAFLWTVYILLAVGGSILWVARFAAVSGGGFSSPAARIMLVVIAIGATVLWPMVRLSQASPRAGALGHVLADTIIVLVPIQLVLWPLVALASWPLRVVGGVAADLTAWVALTGGLLAIALTGPPATSSDDPALGRRTLWMFTLLVLVGWAPLVLLGLHPARVWVGWLPMLSPFTAIPALTGTGVSGPQSPVSGLEYRMIVLIGMAAAGTWLLASVRAVLGKWRNTA